MTSLFLRLGSKGKLKGHDVLFLLSEADEIAGVGFANAHYGSCIIRIRISDAPDLAVGDVIEDVSRSYKIITEPRKDIHCLVWEAEVECS